MKTLSQIISGIEKNKANVEFMPTGFSKLDDFLDGGFMRKELIVLGGNSGIGKSYIAGQIYLNIAGKGFKCGYFSLEISNEMVVSRFIGSIANIKPTRIMSGLLKEEEFDAKNKAKASLLTLESHMGFHDDLYKLEELKKYIKSEQYEFVIIDFIQNIFADGKDEYDRLSRVALELQKYAKEQNCTIMVLSQLSNQMARQGSKAPTVEYKGSGSIVTVCDLGFLIERNDFSTEEHLVTLNLRKNRRGVSNVGFNLKFQNPGGYIYEE